MSAPISAPFRILCIHGYRQNGSTFREKTGALRKLLKKQVELVYIDAPHRVPGEGAGQKEGEQEIAGGEEDPRGWWFSDVQAKSFDAGQECEASLGLEESVEAVRQAVQGLGPFDGILGFSQGAALVAMLCALQEQGKEPQFKFRFAILVAGFRSACAQHGKLYEAPALSLPSLHVFGQTDRVIPEAKSQALLSRFNCPQVLTHPGGHFVPAASAHRQIYLDFLKKLQNEGEME
ncbi:esterase OVCA2 [Paramormyrops kingsleyae]|uniref:Esterase OVCA2 n=1 Tax=Paramormyrops kingsleyae TaxID=1676925 RepID=A0A3B3S4W6_9TELE|nr:esterase OVCA2 [Paramormyrops kingsleyae]